jgi:hypothetical protein
MSHTLRKRSQLVIQNNICYTWRHTQGEPPNAPVIRMVSSYGGNQIGPGIWVVTCALLVELSQAQHLPTGSASTSWRDYPDLRRYEALDNSTRGKSW